MYQGSIAPASNRADFERLFQIIDEDTGSPIDLSTATIVFEIAEPGCRPVISATTDNGKITIVENSVLRVFIPRSEMTSLCAGQYELGATVENADQTESFLVGNLSVLDGRVAI